MEELNDKVEKKNTQYPIDQFFPCYSTRIYEHLINNGFEPYESFWNIKTSKRCHVYKKTDEVCACIAEVSNVSK